MVSPEKTELIDIKLDNNSICHIFPTRRTAHVNRGLSTKIEHTRSLSTFVDVDALARLVVVAVKTITLCVTTRDLTLGAAASCCDFVRTRF